MPEKFSRTMVLIEAILFLIPLALISLVGFVIATRNAHFILPIILFGGVQVLAGGVVIDFVIGGRESLRDFGLSKVIIFSVSAFFVLFASLVSSSGEYGYEELGDNLIAFIDVGVWGFPALVPFVHLLLERHFYLIRTENDSKAT